MTGEQLLTRRVLYMLPTQAGIVYAAVVAALLLAALNYGNGLIYGLAFWLAAIGVVTMLHTHRNLSGLRVRIGACPPVFAGETARFELLLVNDAPQPRRGVVVELAGVMAGVVDLPANRSAPVEIAVATNRRGNLALPQVTISTHFPLGLLRSWSRRFALDARCLVYPSPAPDGDWPHAEEPGHGQDNSGNRDGDELAGQRAYRPGDSPRRINWRAAARGLGLVTREYGGASGGSLWLDFDLLEGLATEPRLSVLCRMVLEAERHGLTYGLRLAGSVVAPGNGELHQARCLEALALFHE